MHEKVTFWRSKVTEAHKTISSINQITVGQDYSLKKQCQIVPYFMEDNFLMYSGLNNTLPIQFFDFILSFCSSYNLWLPPEIVKCTNHTQFHCFLHQWTRVKNHMEDKLGYFGAIWKIEIVIKQWPSNIFWFGFLR